MISEINPTYSEGLIVNFDSRKKYYYLLFANRKDLIVDDQDILEDDCLIAYSDESREEIVAHRSSLIRSGYYKATELYLRVLPNFMYKKVSKMN